jgi:hypothetical protein
VTTRRWPRAWGWLIAAALAVVLWVIVAWLVIGVVRIINEVIQARYS